MSAILIYTGILIGFGLGWICCACLPRRTHR